jgi:glycosyltransferase involved in cell wall biosynthesis
MSYYKIADLNLHYIDHGKELLKSYSIPTGKIIVTYNSPDTDLLFDAKKTASELGPITTYNPQRLIHIGRLVKWKRVDMLINAVNELQVNFPDIELIIIGNGPETIELKKQVEILKLSHKINFVGAVYDPVLLGRYFLSSSVYVLAGMGGLSINEAMLFGKPVICSVCDGTEKKLVRDGFNGYFFENGNLISLKEKISLLLSDKNKIDEFGKNSVSIIKDEVNIHTVVAGYLNAFTNILNNLA